MNKRRTGFLSALALATCLVGATDAHAVFIDRILLNHPNGSAGGDYILRIDLAGEPPQTFNGEKGDAFVTLSLDPATHMGQIAGTVLHNQSGDLWNIVADLNTHIITQLDGSMWNTTDGSGDLYDAILDDMQANATSTNGQGESFLKSALNAADRLAFEIVDLEMNFLGSGMPDFIIPGQPAGTVMLNQFPDGFGDDMFPFMIAKGHRLGTGAVTDPLTGFGWLADGGTRNGTRDFLFVVGQPIPEPSTALLVAAGILGLAHSGRRRPHDRNR